MVYLAGVDQVLSLTSTNVEPVPFGAVKCEPGDGQCLALGAGLLDPIVGPAGGIAATSDLGHDALKPDLAGVAIHFLAVSLKALAELNVGIGDQLLEVRLALGQRQLPQIVAVEIQEVEGDHHDLR